MIVIAIGRALMPGMLTSSKSSPMKRSSLADMQEMTLGATPSVPYATRPVIQQ